MRKLGIIQIANLLVLNAYVDGFLWETLVSPIFWGITLERKQGGVKFFEIWAQTESNWDCGLVTIISSQFCWTLFRQSMLLRTKRLMID
jgi:hypothetical protein